MKGFTGFDPYDAPQLAACAWLIDDICSRRQIVPTRYTIVSHADVAPKRKIDPVGLNMDVLRSFLHNHVEAHDPAYYVVPSLVNVRQGPGTNFPVAGQFPRGTRLLIDDLTKGEMLSGTDLWAHLSVENECRDLGFIHSRLLRQG